eukprot:3321051-Rhodomonas_salina.1
MFLIGSTPSHRQHVSLCSGKFCHFHGTTNILPLVRLAHYKHCPGSGRHNKRVPNWASSFTMSTFHDWASHCLGESLFGGATLQVWVSLSLLQRPVQGVIDTTGRKHMIEHLKSSQ